MSSENPQINVGTVKLDGAERRSVGVIALISMIRMFGLFALLPVLSPYVGNFEQATSMLIGLAVGAYGLTAAGFQIPLGALSDRLGRIPVIVFGLGIFAAGSIVAAMSDTIYGVIVGRLLQGAGAISATLTALIADATREEVRTRSMAVFGVGIGLSFVLAMIIGPLLAAVFGVKVLFWGLALLALLAGLLLLLLPDVPAVQRRKSWSLLPALRVDLLRIDFYVFLLHVIMTATFVALPFLLIKRSQLLPIEHWKMYVGALLVSLVVTVPMILKDQRQGSGRLMGLAVCMVLVAQLGLAFASFGQLPIFIALAVYFAGFNFLEASLPARLSVLADDDVRGASLGVFSSAQFLGAFVGGLIGGRFLGLGGDAEILNVFFVCALLAAIWLALQGFGRFRDE